MSFRKKKKSIKRKLMLSIVGITALLNVFILLVYSFAFNSFFDEKSTQVLLDAHKTMGVYFQDKLRLARQIALRMSSDNGLRYAVIANDGDTTHRTALRLATESKVDVCVITDETGKVLARTHADMIGDSLAEFHTVRAALSGESSSVINSGPITRLSVNGGAPVLRDRNIVVGTVTVGLRLDSNTHVDEIKKMTSQEIMVFLGDTCIASTVADENGQRVTGFRADPAIAGKVLAGERHMDSQILFGENHQVYYSPLYQGDEVIGILVSALSVSARGQTFSSFLLVAAAVSLAALALMLTLVYRAVNNIVRPIHELAIAAQHVTDCMTDRDMCVMVEDLLPKSDVTEIDFLQNALRTTLERINNAYDLQVKSMEMEIEKERILAASVAKDRVFANISHEIRTPMNAILGISDILLHEGGLTGQQRQYLRDVKISTENLLVIVNDVLDLSKLEAGKMRLAPEEYDFELFLSSIDSLAGHLAEERNLRFHLIMEGEVPKCLYGDDVRLRQILINLVGNAVKFTQRGSVTLEVKIEETVLQFTVADTGIGIKPTKMQNLFEAFEQADLGPDRQIGGTGLGLPICKHLVELMDGEIHVESEFGRGSTFVVRIPKVPGDESKIRCWEEDGSVAVARDARILIVDDQKINLRDRMIDPA